MSYRVELSKSGRAACVATACKSEGTKIEKGDLRQGVMVTFKDTQSWKYRHWGCVTPQILHNWKETCEMDMELVDGYDDLPEDAQEKVKRALEEEHVDDDDWNGDVECNRYIEGKRNQGMFLKTPKKGSKKAGDEDDQDESPTKKKPTKKRNRDADIEVEDDTEAAPKKANGRVKKAPKLEEAPEEAAPAKKAKKSKAATSEPEEPMVSKKGRSKKAKQETPPDDAEDEALASAKPKKSDAKQSKAKAGKKQEPKQEQDDQPKAAPKRKGRGKKTAATEDA